MSDCEILPWQRPETRLRISNLSRHRSRLGAASDCCTVNFGSSQVVVISESLILARRLLVASHRKEGISRNRIEKQG